MLQIQTWLGRIGGHAGKDVNRQKLPVPAAIARKAAPRKGRPYRRRCRLETSVTDIRFASHPETDK